MIGMGMANVILGVKITRTKNALMLSQTNCVDKILEMFNSGDSKVARTPYNKNCIGLSELVCVCAS